MINILLVLFGLIIRFISVKQLKGNFSASVSLPDKIEAEGIYKFIRHPCYLGSIILFAGLCYGQYIGFPIFFLAVLFFYDRADREETIMRAKFGAKYDEYVSKTGMFFPISRRS
jgi:protein-S-isoprenylcysteine O-methyltransferase Ste14